MIRAFSLFLFFCSFTSYAEDTNLQKKCSRLASMTVLRSYPDRFVSENGEQLRVLEESSCNKDESSRGMDCEVLIGDGTGSLDVFYNVNLDKECNTVHGSSIYYIE